MSLIPLRRPDQPSRLAGGRVVAPEVVVSAEPLRSRPSRREIVAVLEPVWAAPSGDAGDSVRASGDLVVEAAERLTRFLHPGEVVAGTPEGRLTLRLRRGERAARPVRLQEMAYHAVEVLDLVADAHGLRRGVIDLGVGWAPVTRKQGARQAEVNASSAAAESLLQRDLQPRHHAADVRTRQPRINLWSAGSQIVWATLGAMLVPFLALVGLDAVGLDVSTVVYWFLVGALSLTALTIWAESSQALDPPRPPADPGPAPRATAVIAAYLPNEADTIVETVRAFLAQEYAGGLQVVLAYNTPFAVPVEAELEQLAADHDGLTVLKVADSTSKAQNVNAALRVAEGEFVGIFDADHHPMAGAFDRAWAWFSDTRDPVDVVQGHCVIRNGDDSALARLVAVEFEQIYAVSHPGRAQLHGFGIFGGSNGYWRTSALERIRLRGSFLTEDIEASMRVLAAGGRIVNDPGLISRELAPETPKALWKQRMRWAQGWFQVSLKHLRPILRSSRLTLRQKLGATYLLGWRELYPWIAVLAWPLIGFYAWRDGGLDLTSPIFALVTLFVTVSGPLQTFAAWRLAAPEIRRHGRWFLGAAIANMLVYTEAKNVVARVAHLKQLRGEHQWVVTPRNAPSSGSSRSTDVPETSEEVAA
ncbi:glycosyltransferase [Nocardioides lianchengensis]|uniref:Glycosyltransferase, catalytic subunit of cellulose synthase and poly-beta-1,6-N-acetylglucosamine synthase n=1 Tax=Nocardioides lianchengensis TaxID=1045774 RepID=A0A1G6M154_9ACTN|nr:glycosyltransferase family 2 protein [Nocardioides lianchengensis]NYG12384.1 cellulose synthase/poly-beta-1,6-N-acetylglucosamine synthase-like glycosyltransferase [Nocardioides lianchengensis]SDC49199.1 Glycosyltransferase, catalytic subunit of cellulose synthase and poly-beta-1,6-N-acetylglucosamine synthase [Nocardioides lianchengensis]